MIISNEIKSRQGSCYFQAGKVFLAVMGLLLAVALLYQQFSSKNPAPLKTLQKAKDTGAPATRFEGAQKLINISSLKGLSNIVPIAILGSGPAGLSAAVYGARELNTVVFHGEHPGGMLVTTTDVENWPGEQSILGPDLIQKLQDQVSALGGCFVDQSIASVDFSHWPLTLTTSEGATINALTVIIATGANPKSLVIPGEKEYWGQGVTACAKCDGPFFKGDDVVVIGGGNSAVEEAMQLARHAKTITVLVRSNRMRAAVSMQERLSGYPNITIRYQMEPKEIIGDENGVTGIKVLNKETDKIELLPVKGVFLAIGHEPNTKVFEKYLTLEEGGYIALDGRSQETSVPGVFAAGDVSDAVYRQASVAAGDGVKAVLDAMSFLRAIGFDTSVSEEISTQLFMQPCYSEVKEKASQEAQEAIIDLQSFEDLKPYIEADKPVVIDIYGDTCPSCELLLPVFHDAQKDFSDNAAFVRINIDNISKDMLQKYTITTLPTVLIFHKGSLVARHHSYERRVEFMEFLKEALSITDNMSKK